MSAILFSNVIGPVAVAVVLKEEHKSTLGLTDNPIETGAKVTDHAYVEPKELSLEIATDNAAQTYNDLVRFQESRQPFTYVSGLYVYTNMVITELTAEREDATSRILKGTVKLREVIIVSTARTLSEGGSGGTTRQSDAGKAGGTKSTNAARPTQQNTAAGTTADRATGTVQRGDQATARTVPAAENRSLASRLLGS